jgi:hypothetical protein
MMAIAQTIENHFKLLSRNVEFEFVNIFYRFSSVYYRKDLMFNRKEKRKASEGLQ